MRRVLEGEQASGDNKKETVPFDKLAAPPACAAEPHNPLHEIANAFLHSPDSTRRHAFFRGWRPG